jgi:hypothetical protein
MPRMLRDARYARFAQVRAMRRELAALKAKAGQA